MQKIIDTHMIEQTIGNPYIYYFKRFFYFLKYFGLLKAFKASYYYIHRSINQKKLDVMNKQIVKLDKYELNVIPNDVGISSELRIYKIHEPLVTSIVSNEVKQGMVCLDIGSNIGYYAILESKLVGEEGKIFAIEPSSINFEYLNKNIELANVKNIIAYNLAIGEKNGETNFLITEKSNLSKTISNEDILDKENVIIIPMKRLDSFVDELKLEKIDYLRMDVEGYEIKMFEGIWNVMKKFKPKIQIELHPMFFGMKNLKKFLNKMIEENYDVKYFVPRELDIPLIADKNDIKNYNISKLLEMWKDDKLPQVFNVLLEPKK